MGLSQVKFDESTDVRYLVMHDERKIPIISNVVTSLWPRDHYKLPVVKGKIGARSVDVLRDTECGGVIVRQQHGTDDQYTVRVGLMQVVNNSVRHVAIETVHIDTPYLSGPSPSSLSPRHCICMISLWKTFPEQNQK